MSYHCAVSAFHPLNPACHRIGIAVRRENLIKYNSNDEQRNDGRMELNEIADEWNDRNDRR